MCFGRGTIGWSAVRDISTPDRPLANDIAERAFRRVTAYTSCALVQCGIHVELWG